MIGESSPFFEFFNPFTAMGFDFESIDWATFDSQTFP
jgi:hypothetical protein